MLTCSSIYCEVYPLLQINENNYEGLIRIVKQGHYISIKKIIDMQWYIPENLLKMLSNIASKGQCPDTFDIILNISRNREDEKLLTNCIKNISVLKVFLKHDPLLRYNVIIDYINSYEYNSDTLALL